MCVCVVAVDYWRCHMTLLNKYYSFFSPWQIFNKCFCQSGSISLFLCASSAYQLQLLVHHCVELCIFNIFFLFCLTLHLKSISTEENGLQRINSLILYLYAWLLTNFSHAFSLFFVFTHLTTEQSGERHTFHIDTNTSARKSKSSLLIVHMPG